MAEAIVSIGLQKLCDLLSQEYKQFQGVEDQVTKLKRELELLSSFLKDAEAKKHTSAVVRKVVEQIKDIIYDAEDTIGTFVQKEKLRKANGIKNHIKRLACNIPERIKFALEIGGISSRISTVNSAMEKHGVQKTIANGVSQHLQERQKEMRQEFARDHESDFVGLEANVNTLVGYLVEKDDIRIVSVTGMGGLGKTTLARHVFNHEVVKHHFDGVAWVCVSQDFTRTSVWQTIWENLTSKERKDEILQMKEVELQDKIYRLLQTSKSLIVIDDIWKEEDWNLIKPIFPPEKDWKVLLTSRNESIAMHGDPTLNFKPECLSIQDSWTLFQRITMPMKDAPQFNVNEEMEESAKKMIKHCGGLPLAVKVLGGLLAAKCTVHDWKRLSENIGSHVVNGRTSGNSGSIDNILSMSFDELPSYLKHCFLYLAHFQEDQKINVENLSYYWAAEGISEPMHYEESIRDVGDSCIEELVMRNMVISERDVKTLRFETCHLHDMMREVCLNKAKEENFLQLVGTSSSTSYSESGTSRRFVSYYPIYLHVERDIDNPKLRSLVVVPHARWMLSSSSFTKFHLLRVLHLFGVEFEKGKLPSSIGKLIHLRYLSLERAKVSHLPYSLQNLKLLIYLNLEVHGISYNGPVDVPNVLMGMQELRYLALPEEMEDKTKLELRNLEKLETLKNFSTRNCIVEDLCGLARLRILSVILNDDTSLETLSASVSGLKHLENFSLEKIGSSKRMIEKGIILDLTHLKGLWLSIELSRQQHFPSNLTTITLRYCCLEEDPMPILEKLLQLKEVKLLYKSFSGRRMVCSGGGFPQLQELRIKGLKEWEEWVVKEGSMPLLHTLNIWECRNLKELPDGLRFINSLKKLNIDIDEEWKERLSEGGEDYYKVQHIPSVVFLGE